MEKVSFPIYISDGKKFHWSPDWILPPLMLIPLFILWIFDLKRNDPLYSFLMTYIFILYPISILFLFASFFRHKPLNGTLKGEVMFEKDKIIADNITFELKDINNLDFWFFDYYGYKSNTSSKNFNPKIAQGINNYVSFTDGTGKEQQIFFQLKNKNQYKELAPFINEAIRLKKMQFKQGIDLVGIENVSI
jgi:hypothetical protein